MLFKYRRGAPIPAGPPPASPGSLYVYSEEVLGTTCVGIYRKKIRRLLIFSPDVLYFSLALFELFSPRRANKVSLAIP